MATALALAPADELTWKKRAAVQALTLLTTGGKTTISADDLHTIGEPPHPNLWGSLFRSKELRPFVTHSSYTTSNRELRRSGVIRTWALKPGTKPQALAAIEQLTKAIAQEKELERELNGELF